MQLISWTVLVSFTFFIFFFFFFFFLFDTFERMNLLCFRHCVNQNQNQNQRFSNLIDFNVVMLNRMEYLLIFNFLYTLLLLLLFIGCHQVIIFVLNSIFTSIWMDMIDYIVDVLAASSLSIIILAFKWAQNYQLF